MPLGVNPGLMPFGSYYIPQVSREMVVTNGFDYKVQTQLIAAYEELAQVDPHDVCISTQSSMDLSAMPSNSSFQDFLY
jgi:hypothetical protein